MGSAFSVALVMSLAGALFVPTFIVAIAMLKSVGRAFVLAGTFSLGAVTLGLVSFAGATAVLARRHSADVNSILVMLFAVAGAAAGGVLAVLLLGKLARHPPWRRY